jgi:hypothetical protein
MVVPITPYSKHLGGRDPIAAMRDTIDKIVRLTRDWGLDRFDRTYAPGKWSARQVMIHLAQTELALGARARLALSTPDYVAQPFDQDAWMAFDARTSGRDAADAFHTLAKMNQSCFEALSADQRATAFAHPEYGQLTVDWVVHQMAGHQIHHLLQLQQIA